MRHEREIEDAEAIPNSFDGFNVRPCRRIIDPGEWLKCWREYTTRRAVTAVRESARPRSSQIKRSKPLNLMA